MKGSCWTVAITTLIHHRDAARLRSVQFKLTATKTELSDRINTVTVTPDEKILSFCSVNSFSRILIEKYNVIKFDKTCKWTEWIFRPSFQAYLGLGRLSDISWSERFVIISAGLLQTSQRRKNWNVGQILTTTTTTTTTTTVVFHLTHQFLMLTNGYVCSRNCCYHNGQPPPSRLQSRPDPESILVQAA